MTFEYCLHRVKVAFPQAVLGTEVAKYMVNVSRCSTRALTTGVVTVHLDLFSNRGFRGVSQVPFARGRRHGRLQCRLLNLVDHCRLMSF